MVLWNFDLLSRVCKKLWYYRKNYGTIPKTMARLTKQKKHGRLPTTDNDSHGELDKGRGREKYIQRQLLSIKVS